jgi:hypothetical protein
MAPRVLMILLTALLAACQTMPPDPPIRSAYEGTPVQLFFESWGAPVSAHPLVDGGKVYLWYSGRWSGYIPGENGTTDLIGNDAWWRGHHINWFNPSLECGVRIYTTPEGLIAGLRMRETTKGWWQNGRCREVFGRPIRTRAVLPP